MCLYQSATNERHLTLDLSKLINRQTLSDRELTEPRSERIQKQTTDN